MGRPLFEHFADPVTAPGGPLFEHHIPNGEHMTITRGQAQLAETIAALVAKGHAATFIAEHLNRHDIPTISGRGTWSHVQVKRFTEKYGIGTPRFSPAKIAAVAHAERPAAPLPASPVGAAEGLGLEEPSEETIAKATEYLAALTPEQNDYLAKLHKGFGWFSLNARNEADALADEGASAEAGRLKAAARAIEALLDALASGGPVRRAAWAHHELILMPKNLTSDELMERRLTWLLLWQRQEKADANTARALARQERDPKRYALQQLRGKLKRAQERRPEALARIDTIKADIAAGRGRVSEIELGKLIRRRDKADANIQALIDEIERLEAEV
jgi:hypothetical protein